MRTLRTEEDRRSIRKRFTELTANDRRKWGRMQPGEMVCHLYDSYSYALCQKEVKLHTGPVRSSIGKWLALKSPTKWPRGIKTRPELEQGKGGTKPVGFDEDRTRLIAIFDQFCEAPPTADCPHPMFGVLSLDEWMRWGWLHADHHLRQFGR
jgi:hypothetical protein